MFPCFYVINRAVARLTLFEKQENYEAFERVLKLAHERVPLPIFGYCVMPNHWRRQFGRRQFGDNHKVKLGKKRSKPNGVKLSKMASGLWVSLRYPQVSSGALVARLASG